MAMLESASGIESMLQQRLNCALPVFSLSRVHFRLRGLHGMSEFSRDLRVSRRPVPTGKVEVEIRK
jgi:hypothetical protein